MVRKKTSRFWCPTADPHNISTFSLSLLSSSDILVPTATMQNRTSILYAIFTVFVLTVCVFASPVPGNDTVALEKRVTHTGRVSYIFKIFHFNYTYIIHGV